MKRETVNEIIACMPKERTLFYYFKDRYAFLLLSLAQQHCGNVDAFSKLLHKPSVRQWFGQLGKVDLQADHLHNAWFDHASHFVLSLSEWGGSHPEYQQTSREGYNLVLQLGFPQSHDIRYQALFDDNEAPFAGYGHPVMTKQAKHHRFRETLAWARIDIDFEHNEALIEEIQTDWLREVATLKRDIDADYIDDLESWWGVKASPQKVIRYCDDILKTYSPIWHEAMLSAAIRFIVNELGIKQIYYHGYETGCKLKHCTPPRSLYTKLPKQFCFKRVAKGPQFLLRDRRFNAFTKQHPNQQWFYLDFLTATNGA